MKLLVYIVIAFFTLTSTLYLSLACAHSATFDGAEQVSKTANGFIAFIVNNTVPPTTELKEKVANADSGCSSPGRSELQLSSRHRRRQNRRRTNP
jgi:hypothetical protein